MGRIDNSPPDNVPASYLLSLRHRMRQPVLELSAAHSHLEPLYLDLYLASLRLPAMAVRSSPLSTLCPHAGRGCCCRRGRAISMSLFLWRTVEECYRALGPQRLVLSQTTSSSLWRYKC